MTRILALLGAAAAVQASAAESPPAPPPFVLASANLTLTLNAEQTVQSIVVGGFEMAPNSSAHVPARLGDVSLRVRPSTRTGAYVSVSTSQGASVTPITPLPVGELAAAKIRGALALVPAVLTPRTPEAVDRARCPSPPASPVRVVHFPLDNSSWDKSDWHKDLFAQRLNEVAARVEPRTPEPLALARRRLERPSSPVACGGFPLDESSWDKSEWHRELFAHRLNEVAARD